MTNWQSHHSICHMQKPHAACKFHGCVLYRAELELLPIEVLHCGNREFSAFCCPNLDLDPMTFALELHPYPLKLYLVTNNELSTSVLSKLSYYIHTDRQMRKH